MMSLTNKMYGFDIDFNKRRCCISNDVDNDNYVDTDDVNKYLNNLLSC